MSMLIEYPWSPYNTRRYGSPWAAMIAFKGVKPDFTFIGRYASGRLAFEADTGDIVAMGQKDHRGNNSQKAFYLVGAAGGLAEITEAEALTIHRAQTAVPARAEEVEEAEATATVAEMMAALEIIANYNWGSDSVKELLGEAVVKAREQLT